MGACACFLGGLLDKLLSALVYQRCFDLLEFRLIICRSREKLWVLLISTLCVSCWWGQTGCPSTLCHPVVEARRQSEIILLAAGSWEGDAAGVCLCASFCLFQSPGNKQGDISLLLLTSIFSQTNRLFMLEREESSVEGSCHGTQRHRCWIVLALQE